MCLRGNVGTRRRVQKQEKREGWCRSPPSHAPLHRGPLPRTGPAAPGAAVAVGAPHAPAALSARPAPQALQALPAQLPCLPLRPPQAPAAPAATPGPAGRGPGQPGQAGAGWVGLGEPEAGEGLACWLAVLRLTFCQAGSGPSLPSPPPLPWEPFPPPSPLSRAPWGWVGLCGCGGCPTLPTARKGRRVLGGYLEVWDFRPMQSRCFLGLRPRGPVLTRAGDGVGSVCRWWAMVPAPATRVDHGDALPE